MQRRRAAHHELQPLLHADGQPHGLRRGVVRVAPRRQRRQLDPQSDPRRRHLCPHTSLTASLHPAVTNVGECIRNGCMSRTRNCGCMDDVREHKEDIRLNLQHNNN